MLADSSVYSCSHWQNDMPLFPNYDLDTLEAEVEKMRSENSLLSESLPGVSNNSSQVSSVSSTASSECDYLDLLPILDDDDLQGTVFNHLLDINEPSEMNLSTWMVSDSEADGTSVDTSSVASFTSMSSSSSSKAKRKCKRTSKKSKLDEKRRSAVERLQYLISAHFGLREQLDIMRIINPHAKVSPTDDRFVIDLDNVTEEKLEEVTKYVTKHCSGRSKCPTTAQKQQHLTQLTKKQKAQQQREARQRQRKEHRQIQKEKRSGLFKKEEVLICAVSRDVGADVVEDIDILS